MSATSFLNAEERDRAKALGAKKYIGSRRFKAMSEKYIFPALDSIVATCEGMGFTSPYDGRTLGAFATVMLRSDELAVGYLRKRRVPALDNAADRDELWKLMGLLTAEKYLQSRREKIPAETRLSPPRALLADAEKMFERMVAVGQQMSTEKVSNDEMAVRLESLADPADLGAALIEDAIGALESLVPEIDDDGVPEGVERQAISKAAFLAMTFDDLKEQAAADDIVDAKTKRQIADALAEKHAHDWARVAEIVLKREKGDPEFGLIARLLPLAAPPLLDAAERAFQAVRGRFFEPRVAAFFIFDTVTRSGNALHVTGRIRSFSVAPEEAGGNSLLNPRAFKETVTMILRENQPWVEVNAKRSGDLRIIRSVLRRSGAARPALAIKDLPALTNDDYADWNPRTVWMLDFLNRDLQATDLKLQDTVITHFLAPEPPQKTDPEPEDTPAEAPAAKDPPAETSSADPDSDSAEQDDAAEQAVSERPKVDAVRLHGTKLHNHPDACLHIAEGSRLRDLDIRVRVAVDPARDRWKTVRFRLTRETEHITVMTGAHEGKVDDVLHRQIVDLVLRAAGRPVDEQGISFVLRSIKNLADSGAIADDGDGVFDHADTRKAS
jgi:hypothetical protein